MTTVGVYHTGVGVVGRGPIIYVPKHDVSMEWLGELRSFQTVQEFNLWCGKDMPTPTTPVTRHVVLMEHNHNEILTIQKCFHDLDVKLAEALYEMALQFNHDYVLGYDFQRQEPRFSLYIKDYKEQQ